MQKLCCYCGCSISFYFFFLCHFPAEIALPSPFWEQALSNWKSNTACRMVSIRGRLLYSV